MSWISEIEGEHFAMSDQTVDRAPPKGLKSSLVSFFKVFGLAITIVGAIPTAITLYHAWKYDIPFSQVSHRLTQYDLWVKNIDCTVDYKALNTAGGTKVDVGACPNTGDISIKISSDDGKSTYEWIAYNQLQKPGEKPPTSFIDLIVGAARADVLGPRVRLAQSGMQVMCQSIEGQHVIRVVKEDGKCYREKVSPFRNAVEKREEVPCDTTCKAT